MILVDTSVWVDHIRHTDNKLVELLNEGLVLTHPFVIEELACGNLPKRKEFIELLEALPSATVADHAEVLDLIDREKLYAKGLGSVDAHLLASARLTFAPIWSKDKALSRESSRLGLAP